MSQVDQGQEEGETGAPIFGGVTYKSINGKLHSLVKIKALQGWFGDEHGGQPALRFSQQEDDLVLP